MSTEQIEMFRVTVAATMENIEDLVAVQLGVKTADEVRRLDVGDALVDTGATLLSLPTSLIQQLGLRCMSSKRVTSSAGASEASLYSAVRLTIQGRSCTMDVMEVPDGVPVLIGQLPLEHLDFVIDMRSRTLIGNPAHGGEHVYELY
jgi:predicted aspartyl protease